MQPSLLLMQPYPDATISHHLACILYSARQELEDQSAQITGTHQCRPAKQLVGIGVAVMNIVAGSTVVFSASGCGWPITVKYVCCKSFFQPNIAR